MKIITNTLSNELSHFRALAERTRALLLSIFLRELTQPVFTLFVNAFIWRASKSVERLAVYNLAWCAGLPIGFYLNGLLLRRFSPLRIYRISLLIQVAVIGSLIFTSITSSVALFFFGFAYGVASGLYWGNRNMLELNFVGDNQRNYFFGILSAFNPLVKVIVPFTLGWFIAGAEKLQLYTTHQAYELLIVLAAVALFFAGGALVKHHNDLPRLARFMGRFRSSLWQRVRIVTVLDGMNQGIGLFLPTVMILVLAGAEGTLGTISSVAALFSGLGIYWVARVSKPENRTVFTSAAIGLFIVVSVIFSIWYSRNGAIIYNIGQSLAGVLFWSNFAPIFYNAVEKDGHESPELHYARICDRELFLNIGRATGIFIFLAFLAMTSSETALRFSPLIVSLLYLPVIALLPKIAHHKVSV